MARSVDVPERQPGEVVRVVSADLDGDGEAETVEVLAGGYLRFDERVVEVRSAEYLGTAGKSAVFWEDWPREIAVIDLERKKQALLVELPAYRDEDPPRDYRVYSTLEDRLINVVEGDGHITTPHGTRPTFTTGGGLHIVWTLCVRDSDPFDARNGIEQRTVERYRWIPETHTMTKVEMKKTLHRGVECILAACPFVRVDGVDRGEVLTNLRDASLAGTQIIDLGVVESGTISVEISERKPETTQLHSVVVRVEDRIVTPRRCVDVEAAGCGRKDLELRRGEAETFVFDIPFEANAALHVEGYYVPDS